MNRKRKPLPQDMNGRELVAWNVRRLRVERDLSAESLATQSGVDRVYLSRIERALANATIDILERLASALGVEIAELLAVPSPRDRAPEPLPGGRRAQRSGQQTG
jgi:transcriptional regulator with XRE-family HTH domain